MSDAVMSCEHSLAVLTADAGEVSGDERARARLHASRCPRCSSAYDTGITDVALPRSAHSPPEAAAPLRIGLAIIAGVQPRSPDRGCSATASSPTPTSRSRTSPVTARSVS